jgi:hypothetical protein
MSAHTTEEYLKSLGLEMVREVLEEGLSGPAKVIKFQKKMPSAGQP